jgi:hypothetical protein
LYGKKVRRRLVVLSSCCQEDGGGNGGLAAADVALAAAENPETDPSSNNRSIQGNVVNNAKTGIIVVSLNFVFLVVLLFLFVGCFFSSMNMR